MRSGVKEGTFTAFLEGWHKRMGKSQGRISIGYCSTSETTAAAIKRFIKHCGATVLDWSQDFIEGRTIYGGNPRAAGAPREASFSSPPMITFRDKHDQQAELAAPRDNVVFEAGFFASAKGPNRVLIVRGGNAKMPADLGGDIYAPLPSRPGNVRTTSRT